MKKKNTITVNTFVDTNRMGISMFFISTGITLWGNF